MTTDNKDTPEEKPFQVVLVDLKKAAHESEIVCVEKPLMDSGDLKFIAVSYRWGELLETTVDTGLGYLANIKSFDLESLFLLCRTMVQEHDLKDMEYLWLDAICVDQNNYERRKATIYQMTNIYHRANYIVAVPDLHLGYLREVNKNNADTIQGTQAHSEYIYHLIHGNTEAMRACDTTFLNKHGVPEDRQLRFLLENYTDNFASGFTNCNKHDDHYDDTINLHHIYQTNMASRVSTKHHHGNRMVKNMLKKMGYDKDKEDLAKKEPKDMHKCDNVNACPIELFEAPEIVPCDDGHGKDEDTIKHPWKRLIPERSASVRRSMGFLGDLIMDWSTRVWVISEYHIAKTKPSKKMKYWFIQLGEKPFFNAFFEFDFDSHLSRALKRSGTIESCHRGIKRKRESSGVYESFHATTQRQLNEQSFLEMILKSNATRNEDRMHAILPLTEYKTKLTSKEQVEQWRIRDHVSIKMQLYDWMTTKHRLELLFLSSRATNTAMTLPTFATSTIQWPESGRYPVLRNENPYPCNFNMTDPSIIKLLAHEGGHKLNIKPKEYYRSTNYQSTVLAGRKPKDAARLERLVGLTSADLPDMICIPNYSDGVLPKDDYARAKTNGVIHYIYLIGCLEKNKWVVEYHKSFEKNDVTDASQWEHHYCRDNKAYTGFEIY